YSFEVVAVNSAGSASTNWLAVTTQSATAIAAPQNFTGSAASTTTAQLSWSPSAGATGYSVYWYNGSQAQLIGNVAASTTSVTITGLTAGTTNQFYVAAFNATSSSATAWIAVTQPAAAVLQAPQNVSITATSSTTAQLSWSASAGATGYQIYWL